MEKTIALIPGDGIGPDVVKEAVNVLDAVAKKFGHKWNYTNVLAGGCAIDKFGHPLPQDQLEICLKSDAALLGAVGGPKWDNLPSEIAKYVGSQSPWREYPLSLPCLDFFAPGHRSAPDHRLSFLRGSDLLIPFSPLLDLTLGSFIHSLPLL